MCTIICVYAGLNAREHFGGAHPLDGTQNQPYQLSFSACLKVDFQGWRATSDGGLILIRELDEQLGLEKLIAEQPSDSRQGLNKQFTLADLLRHSIEPLGRL